jgi:hypothetical protein
LETIPEPWREWIAQSKATGADDEKVIDTLVANGLSRAAATADLKAAAADPFFVGSARLARKLKKAAHILNLQAQLAWLDPSTRMLERRANLSRDEFRDRYYAANRPVLIEGVMTGWRAMSTWTPDYLKWIAGDSLAEVMTGRDADPHYERNGPKHRTEMRFADFIDMVYNGKITNDYCMVANNRFLQRPGARPLLRDFTAFPEYLRPVGSGERCFLWFGPAGTVTPLHHATSNILMAEVVGRKRCRLIPAAQWQYVYNSTGVFSDVDCERPDFATFPKFRHATAMDVVVQPGEVLFVPVGWWHHVRALDVSMTVAFTNFVFPNAFRWGG